MGGIAVLCVAKVTTFPALSRLPNGHQRKSAAPRHHKPPAPAPHLKPHATGQSLSKKTTNVARASADLLKRPPHHYTALKRAAQILAQAKAIKATLRPTLPQRRGHTCAASGQRPAPRLSPLLPAYPTLPCFGAFHIVFARQKARCWREKIFFRLTWE